MTIKHERAFGPAIVEEWHLENIESKLLKRWNDINLYEITRGINRFKGLERMLSELVEQGIHIEGYEHIKQWVQTTDAFSNPALEKLYQTIRNKMDYKSIIMVSPC